VSPPRHAKLEVGDGGEEMERGPFLLAKYAQHQTTAVV
jgi:hypothetical protein